MLCYFCIGCDYYNEPFVHNAFSVNLLPFRSARSHRVAADQFSVPKLLMGAWVGGWKKEHNTHRGSFFVQTSLADG